MHSGIENVGNADIVEWFIEDDNLKLADNDILQLIKGSVNDEVNDEKVTNLLIPITHTKDSKLFRKP